MRARALLLVALLGATPADLPGQRVAPVAVRANHGAASVRPAFDTRQGTERRLRGDRILLGAGVGAAIFGTLGALMATGMCDQSDCSGQVPAGLAVGAVVGGLIGGIFGLIVALPPRD